jgi:serine protease Do
VRFPYGGSGVLISRTDGLYTLITASHVVQESDRKYFVKTPDGQQHEAVQVRSLQKAIKDPDLAIVQFRSDQSYPIAILASSPQVSVPSVIFVSGFPAFQDSTNPMAEFSPGQVTSFLPSRPQGYAIHYNASTWKGMSGGPVFDKAGRVTAIHGQGGTTNIGTINTHLKGGQEEENLIKTGFNSAIPIITFLNHLPKEVLQESDLKLDSSAIEETDFTDNNPLVQGLMQYEQGDRQAAMQSYNIAIKATPKNAEVFFQRGLLLQEEGDLKSALSDYAIAINLNPKHINAHYNRAIIRSKLKDTQGAIQDYSRAIAIDPGLAAAYNNRGRLLTSQNDFEQAIRDFDRALKLEPKRANTLLNRGLARYKQGDLQGAIKDYTKAIQTKPDYAKAYGNRAAAQAKLKNRKAAIEDYQAAADLFLDQGAIEDYQQAIELVQRAKQSL